MANRTCSLCKLTTDMTNLERLGKSKDYVCYDTYACWARRLEELRRGEDG